MTNNNFFNTPYRQICLPETTSAVNDCSKFLITKQTHRHHCAHKLNNY